MTEDRARRVANAVLVAAAAAAAFVILRDPRLRRSAWQLARAWAAGPLAVWATAELRHAWDESSARSDQSTGRKVIGG
jgi:hypothetical protein